MSAIVFFLLLGAVGAAPATAATVCSAAESDALLTFKSAISDPNAHLASWTNATNCCTWHNVNCSHAGVAAVDLAWLNLSVANASSSAGSGFSLLAGLVNLVSLDLSGNLFAPLPIPSSLGRLPRLAYLNLSNAGFSGLVPPELGRVRTLVKLDLSVTVSAIFLGGVGNLRVENASFFSELPDMEEIYLDGVDLSASLVGSGCRSLSAAAPKLRVVSLSKCSINCPLKALVSNLTSVTYLSLEGNNLSSGDASILSNFSSLSVVRVRFCGLVGKFPVGIFQLRSLRVADASFNKNLTGELQGFPKNSSLQVLVLSYTNFSGEVPASVGNLTSLARLDLSNARFSGELPKVVEMLGSLEYLDLSANNFTGQVPSLARMKRLIHLDLSSNKFQGSLRDIGFTNQRLVHFNLGSNLFSGSIPETVFGLHSLQKLLLNHNNLSGGIHDFVNASSSFLSSLDLSGNHLHGAFPRFIYKLPHLEELKLSSNNFSGEVELDLFENTINLSTIDLSNSGFSVEIGNGSLSNFPQLGVLKLASCKMTKVPEFLKSQQRLIDLDLSNNEIPGKTPDWIWNLTVFNCLNLSHNRLEGLGQPFDGVMSRSPNVIDLHSNKLQGRIPLFASSSIILDFSNNTFMSNIPTDIGSNLLFSSYISLSNNQLNGGIPASVCNASSLQALDFSHNNLSGSIPLCLTQVMASLKVLNLRSNSISGSIPHNFSSDCNLKTLDLNGNRIVGQIPASLRNCKNLEVLNLGNNNMEGVFPSWFGQMQSLRVLILRSNRFRGRVVPSLAQSSSPLQIIDLSSNSFTGNLCSPSFRSWTSMAGRGHEPNIHRREIQSKLLRLTPLYYQDTVKVTIKGLEIEIEKILTVFTAIDLSNNSFSGSIPEAIGKLNLLLFLNLSHNALTGPIPRSIGNLSQLESLDFSYNRLTGEIPVELSQLIFLSFLNFSFNQLAGQIPQGSQLSTFLASSYLNNSGLCGRPLNRICQTDSSRNETSAQSESSDGVEWIFIIVGLGFGGGMAVSLVLSVLCRKGQKSLNKFADKAFGTIFPSINFLVLDHDKGNTGAEFDEEFMRTTLEEATCLEGRYCVFCTKLDDTGIGVKHQECFCEHLPFVSYWELNSPP